MTYDRIKGLTPVGQKNQNGQALKNSFHLQNQLHGSSFDQEQVGMPYRQQNVRQPGHVKMPSLPANIKGSIGSIAGNQQQRGVSHDAQGENFQNEFKQKYRNFAQGQSQSGNMGQARMILQNSPPNQN